METKFIGGKVSLALYDNFMAAVRKREDEGTFPPKTSFVSAIQQAMKEFIEA